MNKLLKVNCPQCDKKFPYYESEFRPFCSERCKLIDLGHWFQESYRVPLKEKIQNDPNNENKKNENEIDIEESGEDSIQFEDDYEDDENNY